MMHAKASENKGNKAQIKLEQPREQPYLTACQAHALHSQLGCTVAHVMQGIQERLYTANNGLQL